MFNYFSRVKAAALVIVMAGSVSFSVAAQDFTGRVLSVSSGDTFAMSVYGRAWRVKVDGVTPPLDKIGARTARAELASLLRKGAVSVYQTGTAPDGRIIGIVTAGGTDIASSMMARGTVIPGNSTSSIVLTGAIPTVISGPDPMLGKEKKAAKGTKVAKQAKDAKETRTTGEVSPKEIERYLNGINELGKPRKMG